MEWSETLDVVDAATERLVALARSFDDAGVRAPSALPGWSRGHVLTHLARNADGLRGVVVGALSGEQVRQYPSWDSRDADIEAGAGRSATELADDLASSAAALGAVLRQVPASQLAGVVEPMPGTRRSLLDLGWTRVRELGLHGVDLDAGISVADIPVPVLVRLLEELPDRWRDRAPSAVLTATDTGTKVQLGNAGATVRGPTVTGTAADLVGWATGRSDGSGLDVGDGTLPEVPAW